MTTAPMPTLFPFSTTFKQTAASPLTTRFTPPASCTAPTAYSVSIKWKSLHPECWPSEDFSLYQYDNRLWYSPGVCPLGYNYVATSVQSPLGGNKADEVTLAVCCPPGFHSWNGDFAWICRHAMTASDRNTGFWHPLFTATDSDPIYPTSLIDMTFGAFPVSVAWKESDLKLFTPASAPLKDLTNARETGQTRAQSSSSSTPGERSPSSAIGTSTHAGTAHTGDRGLSNGAAAGIAVAGTIVVVALLVALWMISRRYQFSFTKKDKRNARRPASGHGPPDSTGYGIVSNVEREPEVAELPYTYRPHEVDSGHRSELDASPKPVEIAGRRSYWGI